MVLNTRRGEKNREKKKVIDTKLKALLGHVPPHHVGVAETF
jgi:hypothetical protein